MNTALATQQFRVIVPSYAQWFDRDKISDIERSGLPEFFSGKVRTKTPEVYREIRDFMVDTYRLNPTEYLTLTACRRNLASDVGTLIRVHQFLEHWGIINYQIDPETRPSILGPQYTGHFQITLDAPQGLKPAPVPEAVEDATKPSTLNSDNQEQNEKESLETKDNETDTGKDSKESKDTSENTGSENSNSNSNPKMVKKEAEEVKSSPSLVIRRSVYDTSSDAMALMEEHQRRFQALTTRQYNCFTTNDDVTKLRFHNLQSKQVVSATALKQGLFPANYTAADYIKLEQSQLDLGTWSNTELLLLLEGIEMFDNDWDQIAYHVGTRSRESCLAKFLQLPIEDTYLEPPKPLNAQPETGVLEKIKQILEPVNTQDSQDSKDFKDSQDSDLTKPNPFNDRLAPRIEAAQRQNLDEQHTALYKLVELELQKLQLKSQKFGQLEQVLDAQRRHLETERQELVVDRLALNTQAAKVCALLRRASETSGEEAVHLAQQAQELAQQTPRLAANHQADETEVVEPVSVVQPLTYKFWSA